jgi:hypothetical protein
MMAPLKFDQVITINGQKLDKHYIQSLTKQQRLDLIDPILQLLRQTGWLYPDDENKVKKSYRKLLEYQPNLNVLDLFNNSSLATDICKHYCHHFYLATETGKPTLLDNFANDDILKKIIHNRLGLGWLEADDKGPGVNEAFNLSFKMIAIQGQRSMRLVNATSMFKPSIAKYLYLKYSQDNDVVYDYSAGFGGRMLGAASCGRRYIGTDPLTTGELETMKKALQLDKVTLIANGSEHVKLEENSVDFSFSSPPYFDQEAYATDTTQAYNNGEDYFYDIYWAQTLDNVKYMLKPGKMFGLNVLNKYSRMIDMAKQRFGEPFEIVQLRTVRSHLTKQSGIEKMEPVFMFRNVK